MRTAVVLALVLAVTGVHCTCPKQVLDTINNYYISHPPENNLLQKLNGRARWFTVPGFYKDQVANIKCGQSIFAADGQSVVSVIDFKSGPGPVLRVGSLSQEQSGVLKYKVNNVYNGANLYVLYVTDKSFTYYECNELDDTEGFSGISFLNLTGDNDLEPEFYQDLKILRTLSLPPLSVIKDNCACPVKRGD